MTRSMRLALRGLLRAVRGLAPPAEGRALVPPMRGAGARGVCRYARTAAHRAERRPPILAPGPVLARGLTAAERADLAARLAREPWA